MEDDVDECMSWAHLLSISQQSISALPLPRVSPLRLQSSGMDVLHSGRVSGAWTVWSLVRKSQPSIIKTRCSKNGSQSPQNRDKDRKDRLPTDWDKAWSSFRKQGKKTLFSEFKPDKYVSWNPRRSEYPLSEEIDPIKRTERTNLMLWTSPKFTLAGAIILVTMLLIYTLLAPHK